jgi:hypothetical protein
MSGLKLLTGVPPSVVSSSSMIVNVMDYGAKGDGVTDDTAAIQAADAKALELMTGSALGLKATVVFPGRTFLYSKTLRFSVPWAGVPRKTILKKATAFTYEGPVKQFSATNANFATAWNAATADTVSMNGIDWHLEATADSGSGSVGLANVAGGDITNCQLEALGTHRMGAPLDIYACVHNLTLNRVWGQSKTAATEGGGAWIRNLSSEPTVAGNNTENIDVVDSYFSTTTGDEALAVFGVFGLTRRVKIENTSLEALPSARGHAHIASTFPLSSAGANTHAGVEDVEWNNCRFTDTNGTLNASGNLLVFGQTGDEANICQNVRHVDCTFVVQATNASVTVVRNVTNLFEGGASGNAAINATINAVGSGTEIEVGIRSFPQVEKPTIVGNVKQALRSCNKVIGGTVEANQRATYDCVSVIGTKIILPKTTGQATYYESASTASAELLGCNIEGGECLVNVHATVPATAHIDIAQNTMVTAAESGSVVASEGTAGCRVRLRGNTLSGPVALARAGTIIESTGNDWYGVLDKIHAAGELFVPTNVHVSKNNAEKAEEEQPGKVQSGDRGNFTNEILLTSGVPLMGLEEVPPFTLISWIGFEIQVVEGTPANRQNLFVALLDENGKQLAISLDYASATNTPMSINNVRALKLTTPYLTGTSWIRVRPLICEKVSAGNCLTLLGKEGKTVVEEIPKMCGTYAPGEISTPASLPETVALTAGVKRPYCVLG